MVLVIMLMVIYAIQFQINVKFIFLLPDLQCTLGRMAQGAYHFLMVKNPLRQRTCSNLSGFWVMISIAFEGGMHCSVRIQREVLHL